MVKPSMFFLAAAALAATSAPFLGRGAPQPPAEVKWPARYEGRALAPMAPAPEDARLARDFPGRIARFSDGRRQIVLRSVATATRQLHPAGDCFRALGYAIEPLPMMSSGSGALASCFRASRNGASVKVCERIVDARGGSFSDASAWYWPALLGRSRGPWLAATTIESVPPDIFTGVKH
ncbi:hypothetical protein [Allosphingosinicella deserti]|nr:hypothetical protein [Sphingomonas deserti]